LVRRYAQNALSGDSVRIGGPGNIIQLARKTP
jgi:hypothetical protein